MAGMTRTAKWPPSEKYVEAETALNDQYRVKLGVWLQTRRLAGLSWQDVAYDLRRMTGVKATHETCRSWMSAYEKRMGEETS